MASGFDSCGKSTCEGEGCRGTTEVTYYVDEKKKLCEECATKTGYARKERKGGINLFCEKHDQPLTVYCKTDDVSVCHLCAVIKHQKPCELQDVNDAVAKKKHQLLDLQATARDKTTMWKKYGEKICLCKDYSKKDLISVQDQVDSLIDDEIRKVKAKANHEATLINKEADDEIQRIHEKREKRLKQCTEDADKQLKSIEDKRRVLHSDVTIISDTIQTKINSLQKQTMNVMESIHTTAQRIEDLLQDDKELVSGVHQVIASFTDRLEKTVEEGVVEHITRTVRSVEFIEGVGKEKYNGRIGGYYGKWELTQTIQMANKINTPIIVGLINDSFIITSYHTDHTYTFNLIDESTKEIVTSDGDIYVWSCFLLNEEEIVCGMAHKRHISATMEDAIRLYDRQWNLIKCISLPNHPTRYSSVDVFGGTDGMIVAAAVGQPNIYIFNPTDGKIINNIACKYDIALCGVLASGHIILHKIPIDTFLLITDMNGVEIAEITLHGNIRDLTIDPLTEDIYVVYRDELFLKEGWTIDKLSSRGEIKTKNMLTYIPKTNEARFSRCLLSSGMLILSDGKDCLVYKKMFHL